MKRKAEADRSRSQDQGLGLQLEGRQGTQSIIQARTALGGNDTEEAGKMLGISDQHLNHKVRESYNYLGWKDLWRTSASTPRNWG